MPKYYGTALYGRGNYGAATEVALTAARASHTLMGEAVFATWHGRVTAAPGMQSLVGQGAALSWQAVLSDVGVYRLTGAAGFARSNIWTGGGYVAGNWTPLAPEHAGWTPVTINPQNWSET